MKQFFHILFILLIGIIGANTFTSCSGDDDNNGGGNGNGGNGGGNNANTPTAAFAQFGVDIEEIKPNLYTPNETTIQYGNKVDNTVYYRKAAWLETHTQEIDIEIGNEYNEKVFDYIKSISADGKCYENKTMADGTPAVIESYSEITGLLNTFSFKYNNMWVDVYLDFSVVFGSGSEKIGVNMNGSGSY